MGPRAVQGWSEETGRMMRSKDPGCLVRGEAGLRVEDRKKGPVPFRGHLSVRGAARSTEGFHA